MDSNLQYWTDVAVGRCVGKSVTPEEAVCRELCLSIAQLLAFYRREVPPKWADRIDEGVPSQLGYDIADRMKGDVLFGAPMDIAADELYSMLERGDLTRIPELSPKAWQVVKEVTGLSKEEWERLPGDVRSVVEKNVTCPKCNLSGKLADIAVLVGAPDPHSRGSGMALHFNCEWCGSELTLNTTVAGFEITDKRWPETKGTFFWMVAAGFVITFLGILWLVTLK